jgi:hypothetical protein
MHVECFCCIHDDAMSFSIDIIVFGKANVRALDQRPNPVEMGGIMLLNGSPKIRRTSEISESLLSCN